MRIVHADTEEKGKQVAAHMLDGSTVFVLVYMEHCGPCMATRPEWTLMEQTIARRYENRDDIVIADVNQLYAHTIPMAGSIEGFPTIRCVQNRGKRVTNYEDSGVRVKNRSADSFVAWIDEVAGDTAVTSGQIRPPKSTRGKSASGKRKSTSRKSTSRKSTKRNIRGGKGKKPRYSGRRSGLRF